MKGELSQYKQQAITIEKLRKSWIKAAKSVAEISARTLMAGVNLKVRSFFMQPNKVTVISFKMTNNAQLNELKMHLGLN